MNHVCPIKSDVRKSKAVCGEEGGGEPRVESRGEGIGAEVCAFCGKMGNLWTCGGCKEVAYCNGQCQRAHWAVHSLECGKSSRSGYECSAKNHNSEMQWEVMSGKGRWIVSSDPFVSYDVVVCNNSRRAVKGILQKGKAERKKHVSWPPDLISMTERDVAAICNLLESSDDTVQKAFDRFKQLAQRGDPVGRGKQARLYKLAVNLYYKGMAYIFRTPRRLLEHLARSEKEHVEGMFKSEALTPEHKPTKPNSALLTSESKPRGNRALKKVVKSKSKSKPSKASDKKVALNERDSTILVAIGDIKRKNRRESKCNLGRKSANKKRKRGAGCNHREATFGYASDSQVQKKNRSKTSAALESPIFGMLVDESQSPAEENLSKSRVGMLFDESSAKAPVSRT